MGFCNEGINYSLPLYQKSDESQAEHKQQEGTSNLEKPLSTRSWMSLLTIERCTLSPAAASPCISPLQMWTLSVTRAGQLSRLAKLNHTGDLDQTP